MNDPDGLSWNLSDEIQQENIRRIVNTPDYHWGSLILPGGRKDCWMNCAKVLEQLSDRQIIPLAERLMEWLKDGNWPGSELIAERLLKLPLLVLTDAYRQVYRKAQEEKDTEWMYYLSSAFGSAIND